MGNKGSKVSSDSKNPFKKSKSQGHTLGTSANPPTSSKPPSSSPPKMTGGKTLGGSASNTATQESDPRAAAARAAEQRAAAGKGGKLQSQLDAQKKQSRNQTLDGMSSENRRARDADEAAEARDWN